MKTDKELICEIETALNRVQQSEGIIKRRGWTHAFLDELKRIGGNNDFKVYASSLSERISENDGGGEWLFDLCWSKEKKGNNKEWNRNYEGLKLICECEWSMDEDEIIYDFQKLAIGKADIKLMIIQYKCEEQFQEFLQACQKSISPILINDGATYFLIGSGNDEKDISVKFEQLFEDSTLKNILT